jgi:hypothetical protein
MTTGRTIRRQASYGDRLPVRGGRAVASTESRAPPKGSPDRRSSLLQPILRLQDGGTVCAPAVCSPMTFEELLTLLLGWAGRRLQVAVATCGEPAVTVALIAGVLAGGEELLDEGRGAVAFSFVGAEAGFVVARVDRPGRWWCEVDGRAMGSIVGLLAVSSVSPIGLSRGNP